MCFSSCRDNYAFVTFFDYTSAAEAIESEFQMFVVSQETE